MTTSTELLKEALRTNDQGVRIVFTKADGTERVMRCSLNPSLLPAATPKESKTARAVSTETLAVYDLENEGWRSFRYDSVIEVSYIERGSEVIFTL